MGRLSDLKGKELISALSKIGLNVVRIKGDHAQIKGIYDGQPFYYTITVNSKKPVSQGIVNRLIKKLGMTKEEFIQLLDS
jgi:predicted RNA binding protein YcfA (HicA-like mRNA interferase family)